MAASVARRWLATAGPGVTGHSERRLVPQRRSLMYAAVADVERYQDFLPWCTQSRVLHRFSPTLFDAELHVGFKLFYGSYVSRVELVPETAIRVKSHSSPIMQTLTNDWTFEDGKEPNTTLVTFDVAFRFRNDIHSHAAKLFFHEVHARMLQAFLLRAQELSTRGRV